MVKRYKIGIYSFVLLCGAYQMPLRAGWYDWLGFPSAIAPQEGCLSTAQGWNIGLSERAKGVITGIAVSVAAVCGVQAFFKYKKYKQQKQKIAERKEKEAKLLVARQKYQDAVVQAMFEPIQDMLQEARALLEAFEVVEQQKRTLELYQANAVTELATAKRELADYAHQADETARLVRTMRIRFAELRVEKESLESFLEKCRQDQEDRAKNLQEQLQNIGSQYDAEKAQRKEFEGQQAELRKQLLEQQAQQQRLEREVQEYAAVHEQLAQRIADLEKEKVELGTKYLEQVNRDVVHQRVISSPRKRG